MYVTVPVVEPVLFNTSVMYMVGVLLILVGMALLAKPVTVPAVLLAVQVTCKPAISLDNDMSVMLIMGRRRCLLSH